MNGLNESLLIIIILICILSIIQSVLDHNNKIQQFNNNNQKEAQEILIDAINDYYRNTILPDDTNKHSKFS